MSMYCQSRTFVLSAFLGLVGVGTASAQGTFPASTTESGYLTQERLERVGPPFGFLSVQHFYAIMKRCEVVAPDSGEVAKRAAAFQRLVDEGKTMNGQWRTFADSQGRIKETHFATARQMVESPEFLSDVKRYHQAVAATPQSAMRDDCAAFVDLVNQAADRK